MGERVEVTVARIEEKVDNIAALVVMGDLRLRDVEKQSSRNAGVVKVLSGGVAACLAGIVGVFVR